MIPLRTRGKAHWIEAPLVKRITRSPEADSSDALILEPTEPVTETLSAGVVLSPSELPKHPHTARPGIYGCARLDHLQDGDVVAVHPNGLVETLYREESPHNALFITDRCNSNCLMCSQPPKDRDDLDHLFHLNTQLIPMIPKTIGELGITGGEPTLLGNRLYHLLRQLQIELPDTEVHMLTNGRMFAWKEWAWKLGELNMRRLMLGIPLYSDYGAHHDFIVQAKDAFSQTMLGLYNLAKVNQRLELRIVLHKQTIERLPKFARFIYKNLPFVEHVTFMGLEYTGYTPFNDAVLWIDPVEYRNELAEAVHYLDDYGMNVSIYNLQHCLIPEDLWKFSRPSISDWKRTYLDECQGCALLDQCGGVFATSQKYSDHIQAFPAP